MKGKEAKVSLIVPVYNVEKYLGRCLESCIEQTLNDLEIICVDDGSTDRSLELLHAYEKEDSRITVIHKENGGLSSARNAGLKVANGEWIMFLDSDDYLEPNACERVWVESMEAWTEIIVFGSNFFPSYPVPEDANWLNSVLHTKTKRFEKFEPDVLFEFPGAKPFVWRQAFSSRFIRNYHLKFDETAKFGEDILFQFAAFPHANKITFIEDQLYNYRIGRKDSLMSRAAEDLEGKMSWHIEITDRIFTSWEKEKLMEKYRNELLAWSMHYIAEILLMHPTEDNSVFASRFREVINKHGLEKYCGELPIEEKRLWNKIRKL